MKLKVKRSIHDADNASRYSSIIYYDIPTLSNAFVLAYNKRKIKIIRLFYLHYQYQLIRQPELSVTLAWS